MPTDLKDIENFDVDDRINQYMHHIEKGVSKTLENILQEIMTFKGKKVNLHFKSAEKRKRMKSFASSPSN